MEGSTAQVRRRLEDRLCVVGDVWFPTRGEMKRWDASPAPLYLKWTRRGGFEIGPRLDTIPAARLVPVLTGRLTVVGTDRVAMDGRLRWPRLTRLVLLGFSVALAAWGVYTFGRYFAGETHLGWVGAWAASVVAVHGGAAASWVWGRKRLLAELPWLREVLARPIVAGQDWDG